ncbi:MAG TPA: hypothetical protein VIC08_16240 [Cellvibrionaceae bacterium]
MNSKLRILLVLIPLLGAAACSNRTIYDGTLISQRNDCLKEPPGQYQQCLERNNKSYDEYQREREEILEE